METGRNKTARHLNGEAWLYILWALLGANSCQANGDPPVDQATLVDVLANPRAYAEQQISVMGYLVGDGSVELYLSKAHFDARDHKSAILVADYDDRDIGRSACGHSDVEITGTVRIYDAGDFTLVHVVKIALLATGKTCWSLNELASGQN